MNKWQRKWRKKWQKYFWSMLVAAILLVIQVWQQWPDAYAHLIFCDVGQGDGILITNGFTQILVDGGRTDSKIMACLRDHLPFWDRSIELVVATHADADHIGGLDKVLDTYAVQQIMSNPFVKDTQTFWDLKAAIEKEVDMGVVLKKPISGQQISFSQEEKGGFGENFGGSGWNFGKKKSVRPAMIFSILSPRVEQLSAAVENWQNPETYLSDTSQILGEPVEANFDHNDLSIGALLTVGEVRLLLMADIEQKGELALINSGLLTKVDILKAGHHGSKTSTSPELLAVTQPEISVISVGKNNKYGHPSPEVMSRLMQFGGLVVRTDELSTIEIVTDGEKYWLAE